MGNPKRYIFNDDIFVKVEHKYNKEGTEFADKKITLHVWDDNKNKMAEFYEAAKIDFYSAPDVIMTYSNGNTCKDEWRRYFRWTFKNLKLISKTEDATGESTLFAYSYEEFKDQVFNWDNPEQTTNIPMGKFAGMTYEQVQNYKRKNRYYFKGESPSPSKEALEAAYDTMVLYTHAKFSNTWPLMDRKTIEAMLIAAYKIDY